MAQDLFVLMENPKSTIDACLANIAQHLPAFKHRPSQHAMITAVRETFSRAVDRGDDDENHQHGESILVVEGPTGTGKSLAYLLPAVIMAKASGRKLVVSSATVALQEQLANKELPFLVKYAGIKLTYAIAKGRGRYACTYRLNQQAGITQQDTFQLQLEIPETEPSSSVISQHTFLQMAELLAAGEWSGDRDNLIKPVSDTVWSQMTNDRHGCLKTNCPNFVSCPFYVVRKTLDDVDIIIANHDLLLADIAMGGGVILPDPTETFYCLDEAHHLADKAIKQFAANHTIYGTMAWLEKIDIAVTKARVQLKDYKPASNIQNLVESLFGYLQDLGRALMSFPELQLAQGGDEPAVLRFKHGTIPSGLVVLTDSLATTSRALLTAISLLQESLKREKTNAVGGEAALFDRSLSDLGFFIGRLENVVAVWTLFSLQQGENNPPIAKWISAKWSYKNQQEQLEYSIHASPVSAAKLMAERFWCKVAGAVLASATLRSLGTFDLLLNETGLQRFAKTTCLALDSPFDFQKQRKLIVPKMHSTPKDPVAHTDEIIALLPSILPTSGCNGALMLFASRKQMQDVARKLPDNLQSLLLIQGAQSKEGLLREHFSRIEKKQPSILFGLASFAEGLDLPGNACNNLIIAKLPFAVPDDPVTQTLSDWIVAKGGNPFMEMILPATSIKLIQAIGRLIRSETDTGTVTILDTRLVTTHYGKLLLRSLPGATNEVLQSINDFNK